MPTVITVLFTIPTPAQGNPPPWRTFGDPGAESIECKGSEGNIHYFQRSFQSYAHRPSIGFFNGRLHFRQGQRISQRLCFVVNSDLITPFLNCFHNPSSRLVQM